MSVAFRRLKFATFIPRRPVFGLKATLDVIRRSGFSQCMRPQKATDANTPRTNPRSWPRTNEDMSVHPGKLENSGEGRLPIVREWTKDGGEPRQETCREGIDDRADS